MSAQARVGRFVWHENQSHDVEAAKSFYSELLGWGIELWKPGEMDYAMIEVGGATHGGFWPLEDRAIPSHWLGHVLVDDVDASAEAATALGGEVLHGPMDMPEVGRFALLRDPHGAVVSAFHGEGEEESGEGVFLWDELLSPDVEEAKRFYGEVFGWSAADTDMGGGNVYTVFSSGETMAAGLMASPPEMRGGAAWIPYVGADDVDAAVAKAPGLGSTVMVEPMDVAGVGRFAVIADPAGAVFGLFNPIEQAG